MQSGKRTRLLAKKAFQLAVVNRSLKKKKSADDDQDWWDVEEMERQAAREAPIDVDGGVVVGK